LAGLLGAFRDPQFYRDLLDNTRQLTGGLLAGTAGAPVDIMTMLMRPAGYQVPDKKVAGSSEHIGGLLGLNTDSTPYKVGSLLPTDPTDVLKYGGLLGAGMTKAVKGAAKVEDAADYRGLHTAPTRSRGAPAHQLAGDIYPDDIYSARAAQFYGHFGGNHPMDVATVRQLHMLRGKPDAEIIVYRAVPKDAPDAINAGDWVTPNKLYAKDHGDGPLGGEYKIVSKKVRAKDIYTDGNSIHEFGYDPSP
jgi:hypothetical protein